MCTCKKKKIGSACNRSTSFSIEDGIAIGAGVLGGMAINRLAEKATASQSEDVKSSVNKFLPFAKIAFGGSLVAANQVPRQGKMVGIGVGAVGVVEVAPTLAPQFFKIGGVGETYHVLGVGSPDLTRTPIPVVMGAADGYDEYMGDEPSILGAFSNHSEELAAL